MRALIVDDAMFMRCMINDILERADILFAVKK